MDEEIQPSRIIKLAGEPIKVKIDMPAMYDIEQTLELIRGGISKKSIFQLLDPPYDMREMAIILMHGINGNNRFERIDKRLSLEDTGKLLHKHFLNIKVNMQNPSDVKEFAKDIDKLMLEFSSILREAIGFQEMKS